MLCPVSRLITNLDCVLLKDNNRALVARLGPEINSGACLCILQGPKVVGWWVGSSSVAFLVNRHRRFKNNISDVKVKLSYSMGRM